MHISTLSLRSTVAEVLVEGAKRSERSTAGDR